MIFYRLIKNFNGMKKIILTAIFSITLITPILFAVSVYAQTPPAQPTQYEYTVLAPLPGTTKADSLKTDLPTYLPGIFNLAIGLSAAFAVFMIVLGGFQYMSTDALQKKQDGKQRIQNAIYGLFLVIGAWLILYTINPNLLKLDLNIESVSISPATTGGGGTLIPTSTGGVNPGSAVLAAKTVCPGCTFSAPSSAYTNTNNPLRPEDLAKFSCGSCLPLDGIPTNGNTNTNVDPSIRDSILALNEGLKTQNVGWRLNEAFPPTVHHAASCSYNGTCIDVGLTNNTSSNIKKFIDTANNNGLKVQYEVKTESEAVRVRNELKNLGMTGDLTKVVIPVSYINNPHFSVYKKP